MDFTENDPSAVTEVSTVGGFQSCTSPTSQVEATSSSPVIISDSIGYQSPYLAAPPTSKTSPPALKSIIKYPQQPVVQQPQLLEFELIQPPTQPELECQVVFSSQTNQEPITKHTVKAELEMPSTDNQQTPTIAVNGATNGSNGTTGDLPNADLFDPWCDPNNPRVVQFQDISAAAFKIKSGIMMTPCTRSHLSNLTGTTLFFKKDFLQYTGSFKVIQNQLFNN